MKILNINSYFYSSSVHIKLHQALRKNGAEVVSYIPVSHITDKMKNTVNADSSLVLSNPFNKWDRFIFMLKQRKIYNDLSKQIKITNYELIHAHSLFTNGYLAYEVNKNFDIPYVVTIRDTDINLFFKRFVYLRKLGLNILLNAKKIFFLSEVYRDFLLDNYIPNDLKEKLLNKSVVIPNGIDDYWLTNKSTRKEQMKTTEINLLHVGLINKRKNLLLTCKAIEKLVNDGYIVKYTVVGKIDDRRIYKKIKDLPYLNYIEPIDKKALIEIYRKNDILVVPSLTETFGLVYAESMSQGTPVIYTKGQGFDGQFAEGFVGFSVNPNSENEVIDRIFKIRNDYSNFSRNCLTSVDKFNWDTISLIYINEYKNI